MSIVRSPHRLGGGARAELGVNGGPTLERPADARPVDVRRRRIGRAEGAALLVPGQELEQGRERQRDAPDGGNSASEAVGEPVSGAAPSSFRDPQQVTLATEPSRTNGRTRSRRRRRTWL